jgi:amidase
MSKFVPPTKEQIVSIAQGHHLTLSENEIELFKEYFENLQPIYNRLDQIDYAHSQLSNFDRNLEYHHPDTETDPLNSFRTKLRLKGNSEGPLSGYEVGLKDTIPVAGIPMYGESNFLEGYIPDHDATVVKRLLDAGATISGKTNIHTFTFAGEFEQPTLNPHNPERTAGGSSSGSAAAVVNGDIDVAIGGDQGGSIRAPAAYCGCIGLKPTWGLVPYTGVQSITDTLDHIGPMGTNVKECAVVLQEIAGFDPADPRQHHENIEIQDYVDALSTDITGVSIGLLREGLNRGTDPAVQKVIQTAVNKFENLDAHVEEISIPWHNDGGVIANALMLEGINAKFNNDGMRHFSKGFYNTQYATVFGTYRRVHANQLSPFMKSAVIIGEYLADRYQHRFYAKAQNLRQELTQAYDDIFENYDLIALPTKGTIAPKLDNNRTYIEAVEDNIETILNFSKYTNTGQFNVTGNPAMSIPCGMVDGMPVGLQLVGKMFRDDDVLKTAYAFEQKVDWKEIQN